jgi:hypothetical protein
LAAIGIITDGMVQRTVGYAVQAEDPAKPADWQTSPLRPTTWSP